MMQLMHLQMVLGLRLLGVQIALAVVLLRELWRTRAGESVAVLGELFWMIAGIGWVWYGVWTGGTVVAISGALAAVCCISVCVLIRHGVSHSQWRRYSALSTAFAIAMVVSAMAFGMQGLSVFLAVFGFVQFIPQLRLSLTQLINGAVVPGVPIVGVIIRASYTGLWCVYAVAWGLLDTARIDWPLAVWGATGCVAFTLQAAVGLRSRRAMQKTRALVH